MAERLNYLRRMPPLETATFGKLQPITMSMQEQILTRGDSLLTEGGGDAGFFMVHEGELKVRAQNSCFSHTHGLLLATGSEAQPAGAADGAHLHTSHQRVVELDPTEVSLCSQA